MRTGALILVVVILAILAGCGGGESKSQDQGLVERAFQAHSEYLVAEARLLNYWFKGAKEANERPYERELLDREKRLVTDCFEEFGVTECESERTLEEVKGEMEKALAEQSK